MPFLETRFSTDYQVYEPNAMATRESVIEQALSIRRLFVTENNNRYVFELGIHIIIMLCFSIVALKRLREDLRKQYIFCLVSGLICIIMSTNIWPWKWMPEVFLIIQFPWRMLCIGAFFLSIVCGINMAITLRKFQIIDVIIIAGICILYVCAFKNCIPKGNLVSIENWSLGVMSGKEVEVIAGTAKAEYLPTKAYKDRFYIATFYRGWFLIF